MATMQAVEQKQLINYTVGPAGEYLHLRDDAAARRGNPSGADG
jgi:hypothetical protein